MKLRLAVVPSAAAAVLVLSRGHAPAAEPQDGGERTAPAITTDLYSFSVRREPTVEGVSLWNNAGVEFQVALKVPGSTLLSVDGDHCKIRSFVDDKGTNLAAGTEDSYFGWVQMATRFDDDENLDTTSLTITTTTLPAKGASRIDLDATAVLLDAGDPSTASLDVALAIDTPVVVGPIDAKISEIASEEWGDVVMRIELQSSKAFDAIRSIEFQDADGNAIGSEDMGSGSWEVFGKKTYTRSIGLHAKVERAKIVVNYWGRLDMLEVPLRFSAGVGL
ncbi:MAG: hypothetical protein R3F34_04540 [Planctomycetota bacterium]